MWVSNEAIYIRINKAIANTKKKIRRKTKQFLPTLEAVQNQIVNNISSDSGSNSDDDDDDTGIFKFTADELFNEFCGNEKKTLN